MTASNDPPFAPRREEPLTLRARTLGVSLTVKDLAASIVWYRDVACCMIERTFERDGRIFAVRVKAGDVELLLTQDDGAKGSDRAKGDGFSMMLTTAMDIDAYAAAIKARGAVLDTEPADTPWGTRAFRVRDPDGFKLAFSKDVG